MKERQFLEQVYGICAKAGVTVHHCNDARRCHGNGLPDLILIGVNGVLWREVKSQYDVNLRPVQTAVLWTLRAARQDARVWTEQDLDGGAVAREIAAIC
jgi:hypothetical protein